MRSAVFGAVMLAMIGPCARAADSAQLAAGRGIAERYCGGCHAVASGESRLPDAPPFRDLHLRYGPGGLDALLKEGMITPDPSLEEGNMPGHPRMPQAALGVDERVYLAAYLRSLEPAVNCPLDNPCRLTKGN